VQRLLAVLFLSVAAAAPALGEIRILSSSGGAVDDYLSIFAQFRRTGERIVIDGPCLSACTLVLSTIPSNRICVTSRAVLGFHAPRYIDPRTGRSFLAKSATRAVTSSYPPKVQAWLKRKGGLSRTVVYLRGRELAGLYRRCR
jgi:hypothetical protein